MLPVSTDKSDQKWLRSSFHQSRAGEYLLTDCIAWFDCAAPLIWPQSEHKHANISYPEAKEMF